MEEKLETIVIKPQYSLFSNQTSGHSCIIKVANTFDHILKPLDSGEQKFYEFIQIKKPKFFSDFIPKYFGIYYPTTSELDYFAELAKRLIEDEENPESAKLKKKNKMHKSFLQKLYSERFSPKVYIKLEDLTQYMNTPRILDLKLGYNAYNEKKLHSQSKKYQESTCATEGFRFAGLKGHLNKSDEIIFRDKSWGFALKKEDLVQAFGLFFYDGEHVLKETAKKFIDKLNFLIDSLNEMKGYIFNSTSLLLIYDDKCDLEDVQVKLIDFANVKFSEPKNNEPDENLIKALKNIKSYLKSLIENKNLVINLYF